MTCATYVMLGDCGLDPGLMAWGGSSPCDEADKSKRASKQGSMNCKELMVRYED